MLVLFYPIPPFILSIPFRLYLAIIGLISIRFLLKRLPNQDPLPPPIKRESKKPIKRKIPPTVQQIKSKKDEQEIDRNERNRNGKEEEEEEDDVGNNKNSINNNNNNMNKNKNNNNNASTYESIRAHYHRRRRAEEHKTAVVATASTADSSGSTKREEIQQTSKTNRPLRTNQIDSNYTHVSVIL